MREKRPTFDAAPREFPLSVCVTFTREIQTCTHNYTPLSTCQTMVTNLSSSPFNARSYVNIEKDFAAIGGQGFKLG